MLTVHQVRKALSTACTCKSFTNDPRVYGYPDGYLVNQLAILLTTSNEKAVSSQAEDLLIDLLHDSRLNVRCTAYAILKTHVDKILPCSKTLMQLYEDRVDNQELESAMCMVRH